MFDIRIALIGVVLLSIVTGTWWATSEYKESKYTAILAKMQLDAAQAVQAATEKVIIKERENTQIATELEVANDTHRKELDTIERTTRELAANGLYDRNATGSNSTMPVSPAASSNATQSSTSGKLSSELTKLLLSESRRADEAAAYANTCYQWIKKLNDKP